jgi:hypothetical protein
MDEGAGAERAGGAGGRETPLWKVAVGLNALFLAHLAFASWPGPGTFAWCVTANLLLLVAPVVLLFGARWRPTSGGVWLAAAVVCAACAHACLLAACALLGASAAPGTLLPVLLALTNGALFVGAARGAPGIPPGRPRPRLFVAVSLLGLLGFGAAWTGSRRIVPPLIDNDYECGATAHGLARTLTPAFGYGYYLYHPLLWHGMIANGVVLSGRLEETAPYHRSAVVQRALREPSVRLYRLDEKHFLSHPELVRAYRLLAPGVAVMAAWAVALVAARASGSVKLGLAAAAVCFFSPEVFLRTCAAGYTGITSLVLAAAVLAYLDEDRKARALLFACAFVLAWTNHKGIVLMAAMAAHALSARVAGGAAGARRDRGTGAALLGYAAGAGTWAVYGLCVSPSAFVATHLHEHWLGRIGLGTAEGYPGLRALWGGFAVSVGPLFLLLGVVGLLQLAWRGGRVRVLPLWFLAGGLAFSLVDWKQTKHLLLLTPTLAAGLAAAVAAWRGRPARLLAAGAVVACLLYNAVFLARVACDFSWFTPLPGW